MYLNDEGVNSVVISTRLLRGQLRLFPLFVPATPADSMSYDVSNLCMPRFASSLSAFFEKKSQKNCGPTLTRRSIQGSESYLRDTIYRVFLNK